MRRVMLASLLTVSMVVAVRAQEGIWAGAKGQNLDDIKKEILKLREDEAEAIKNKDARALCNLMADGWAGTTEMGLTIHKAEYCDEATDGTLTFPSVHRDEVRFYVFGNDTVEEWWRDTSTMRFGTRRTDVFTLQVSLTFTSTT
jgi:Domain of unknown function (DUF4440)